jgi:hypothetical protein
MNKPNFWVWGKVAEEKYPDRKAGDPVPLGYLTEGHLEYFPYPAWVKKGYCERVEK